MATFWYCTSLVNTEVVWKTLNRKKQYAQYLFTSITIISKIMILFAHDSDIMYNVFLIIVSYLLIVK